MPVQMPYSLLGDHNADDPDHARYGGFLARMEPATGKPSALTHLRWLGLGILIGCTLLTVYQFMFVSDAPRDDMASRQPVTSAAGSKGASGSAVAKTDSSAPSQRPAANEKAGSQPTKTAVITQGRAASPGFADSMNMLSPNGEAATEAHASEAAALSAASESDTKNDIHGSIGDDYPTALLADSLQLSEPALPSSSSRRPSNVSNDDPDVAILQLLLQRIDKKE